MMPTPEDNVHDVHLMKQGEDHVHDVHDVHEPTDEHSTLPPSPPDESDTHDTNKENNGQNGMIPETAITGPPPNNNNNNDHHILVDIAPNIPKNDSVEDSDYAEINFDILPHHHHPIDDDNNNPEHVRNLEVIAANVPTSELEIALKAELDRQISHNELLNAEHVKLRRFISKRKQTYKRKRKDESAPRKKLSGYNLFVRERFAKLKQQNEDALKSANSGAELKRIPPASNIASSGAAWSQLSKEEKARYNEMAKPDEDRFQKETASYTAPERLNRKRARTGYNVFFSKYVLKLKREEGGVPSERGCVARIVGDAWKRMVAEEKDEYEREADEHNETMNLGNGGNGGSSSEGRVVQEPLQEPQQHQHHTNMMPPDGGMEVPMPPPPGMQHPPPMMPPPPEHMNMGQPPPPPMGDGSLPPPHDMMPPPPPGMMHPYPPDYGMHGPPPPVIHQPPGYEGYYGGPPPPYDPYGYPPPPYPPQGMPPGMPMPPEGMPPLPYGPPPPGYQGPPPPYVDM